jgi:hypothetical protein
MAGMKKLLLQLSAVAVLVFSPVLHAAPPVAPLLMTPTSGTAGVDTLSATLTWHRSATAITSRTYTLLVDRDAFFSPSEQTWTDLGPDTFYTVTGLSASARYYWKVRAFDDTLLASAWSTVWNFTTIVTIPLAPVLTSPADFVTGIAINPTLQWDSAVGATSYCVQVSTDPSFAAWVVYDSSLVTTSRSVTLEAGRTYFWRVWAKNAAGKSPWSVRRRLSTVPESYASWTYHKDLVLNTTSSNNGAGIQTTEYNFPVLIRLTPMTFGWFSQTATGGADIRFAKSNGTALPYEIERWVDVGTGGAIDTAEIWVLLDTVGPLASTHITMYWGNGTATSRSDPYRVFDPNGGFSQVWHMNETPTGSKAIKDRTQNACHGTPYNMSGAVQGVIGKALDFDGINDSIKLDTVKTADFIKGMTVSAWVIRGTLFTYNPFILEFSKTGYVSSNKVYVGGVGDSTTLDWSVGRDLTPIASDYLLSGVPIYVSATYCHNDAMPAADSLVIYKDGEFFVYNTNYTSAPFQFSDASDSIMTVNYIGKNWFAARGGIDGLFDGIIDEVQVSRVARDSGWIRLAYQSQRIGQTALCYPPSFYQNPRDTPVVAYLDTARLNVIARGNNLSYQWERSNNGSGGPFNPISGATATLYKLATSPSDTGTVKPRFRCIASTPYYSDTSALCTLTVCVPTVITVQPNPTTTVFSGDMASFSVSATGKSLTYLWQRSDNFGAWYTAPGTATTNPYNFLTAAADTSFSSIRFHCIVSGMCSSSATSQAAALTLCTHISFPTQPHDTTGVVAGTNVHFSVVVNAGRFTPTYQWERSNNGGTTWNVIGSGNGSATYILATFPDGSDNGAMFRCLVTNSPCDNLTSSNAVTLGVCIPAVVDSNPRDTNATIGNTASFRVVTHGSVLTYQWQRSTDSGATYANVASGGTNAVYSFTVAFQTPVAK